MFFLILGGVTPTVAIAAGKLAFNRDIRPILSDKCFLCHGPDPKKRGADLRLDVREEAIKDGHITPGSPEKSLIVERILSHDPEEQMPPAKSKLDPLTKGEIEKLKQWIAEGAEYEAHWSFISLKPDAKKGKNIDSIVASGLAEQGRALQPAATAETLIRRLSFDITGLPPTPEDVRAFTEEHQTDAKGSVEKWVTRLLTSPHYGERMAADWLDVARYADSYGFQVDRDREVWPWRDWVVKAFNDNLPYDQFITWQLAGDLLPNPTDEQIMATAFNRLHQQENEGGSVEEEYRVEYVADRVQTVATAFLGLTFECARCHDHKYDPITQKDYYGLFSLMQNIDEAGLYSFFTPAVPTPTLMTMEPQAKQKLSLLEAKVKDLERQTTSKPLPTPDLKRGAVAHFTFDQLDQNRLADELHPSPPPAPKKNPKDPTPPHPAAVLKGENKLASGKMGQAILFTGDDAVDTPIGNFQRHDPFSVSLWMLTPDVKDRAVVFHRSQAWTDAGSRGYELLIEEGKLKWSLIHFWPGNAISIRTRTNVPLKQWVHVLVTNDGSSRAAGLKIYIDGKLADIEIIRDNLTKNIAGGGHDSISLGERMRDRGFKGGMIDDFRVFDRDVSMPYDEKNEPQLVKLKEARAAVTNLLNDQKEIMVMRELPVAKKAYLLTRGEYDKRGEEVGPGTPAFLPPMPKGAPMNRLGYARWLTAPEHPLTARVTVNRLWQNLFGRGLVKTTEDFGSQGERPLYPELLDYLSQRFIQSGWDLKALVKEIVLSRVYQQKSVSDTLSMTDDPDNQWLARGPRFRLPAEMIRDNALAAAGLLKLTVGGPPVYPYEMMEAFKPVGPGGGDAVYRRSLYTHWRRTSPPPALLAFDAPRRAVCISRRERTDSPLQALILLNGVQYVEAARVLGERLHQEAGGDVQKMIDSGFLRCLSRLPDARERQITKQLYDEQLAHFKSRPQEAGTLLAIGTAKRDSRILPHEAAAATILAQALLNHDACVVKR